MQNTEDENTKYRVGGWRQRKSIAQWIDKGLAWNNPIDPPNLILTKDQKLDKTEMKSKRYDIRELEYVDNKIQYLPQSSSNNIEIVSTYLKISH